MVRGRKGQTATAPAPFEDQDYEVDYIVSHSRDLTDGLQYLVRWAGYGPADDTVQHSSTLSGASDAVLKYWKKVPKSRQWELTGVPVKPESKKRSAASARLDSSPRSVKAKAAPKARKAALKPSETAAKKFKVEPKAEPVADESVALEVSESEEEDDKAEQEAEEEGADDEENVEGSEAAPAIENGVESDDGSLVLDEYDDDGAKYHPHHRTTYADVLNWDDLLTIKTIKRNTAGFLEMNVIWTADRSWSLVPSAMVRLRAPQRVRPCSECARADGGASVH